MTVSRNTFLHRCKNLLITEQLSVIVVGAGNVGWHLAKAIHAAEHKLVQVASRNYKHALEVAELYPGTVATTSLDFTSCHADLVLVAVPDAALAQVAKEIQLPDGACIAHTSGSLPLELLSERFGEKAGVFYPLQTFSKGTAMNVKAVPILLEAPNGNTYSLLKELACGLSNTVTKANSAERKQIHLAAVFACNFTNHLLGISRTLMEQSGLDASLLQPLVQHTIDKAMQNHPFQVQTGPASRGDQNVLNQHLLQLSSQPRYQEIYDLLSQSIQEMAKPKTTLTSGGSSFGN